MRVLRIALQRFLRRLRARLGVRPKCVRASVLSWVLTDGIATRPSPSPLLVGLGLMVAASLGLWGATGAAAGTFREVGDAPAVPPGLVTSGASPLEMIHGTLADGSDVDLYRIFVTAPAAFSATFLGGTVVDAQFFLFTGGGIGVTHDDDTPPGGIFGPTLALITPTGPGAYYLAISAFNQDALGPGALPIWANNPVNVERAPDGPGAPGPITGWAGIGTAGGEYWIRLTGCDAVLPAPQPGMWTETVDAPLAPPGQNTVGSGSLDYIYGAIADTLDADAYCIDIQNPATFSATVYGLPESDTQLFLLDASGFGVAFDDDDPAGGTPHSRITGTFVPGPGNYTLAISSFDRDILGAGAAQMWVDTLFSEERAPDDAGAGGPYAGWSDSGNGTGPYAIVLTGATFCNSTTAVPAARASDLSIAAFPNPEAPAVRIECSLPSAGPVRVGIYDLAGRRVRSLLDAPHSARALSLIWDGRDDRGLLLAPKVYVIRVEFAGRVAVRRVVLLQ
jgi:hypothetical protein